MSRNKSTAKSSSLKRKVIGAIILANIIIVTSATSVLAASKGLIVDNGVNIRESADTESKVIAQLDKGDAVVVASAAGDWFRISLDEGSAFVNKSFVSVSLADGTVYGDDINIRDKPSFEGAVVATVGSGAAVSVIGKTDEFYAIYYQDKTAYIHSDYVVCPLAEFLPDMPYVEPAAATTPAGDDSGESAVLALNPLVASYAVVHSADGLNLRTSPSADAPIILNFPDGAVIDVVQPFTNWHLVSYNGIKGFVAADYVTLGTGVKPASNVDVNANLYAVATEIGVNLRSEPNTNSNVLLKMSTGDAMDVLEVGNAWHKVNYEGTVGFVSADFVTLKQGTKPANTAGRKVVTYAKRFLGTRYSWGGTSLTRGVDCSGFVWAVYRNFGVTLNRTSRDQYKNGRRVSRSNLQAGDIVFFDTSHKYSTGRISHCGIYIGGGQFIHASSGRNYCVTISNLSGTYSNQYVGATRIF